MTARLFFRIGILVLGASVFASSVSAQVLLREERRLLKLPVNERLHEDLTAQGLYYHGFVLSPRLSIQERYDSNVLASESNEKGDFVRMISPELHIKKEYGAHQIQFGGFADLDFHQEESDEDAIRLSTYLRGILLGDSSWSFPFSFKYKQLPRNRQTPQTRTSADERKVIESLEGEAGVTHRFNRLSLTLLGNYESIRNEDGLAFDTKNLVIFSDKDRDRYGGELKARYKIPRDFFGVNTEHILFADAIYGRSRYKNRDFQLPTQAFSGAYGHHDEYGIMTGFETRYKGLLFAKLGAGYKRQNYDDSALKDVNITTLSADVDYSITPKLVLNLNAERDVNPDTGLTQGILTTAFKGGLDYELQHNLYLGVDTEYTNYDFQALTREDEDLSSSVYLKYFNSQNLHSAIELRRQDRTSTVSTNEFERYEVLFRLTGQL
jgi:hypothetical protein